MRPKGPRVRDRDGHTRCVEPPAARRGSEMSQTKSNFFSAASALAEAASAAAEKAKAKAADAASNASARLSDSGIMDKVGKTLETGLFTSARKGLAWLRAIDENDKIDVMLREKNRRILELEEERGKMAAQLKRASRRRRSRRRWRLQSSVRPISRR